MRQMPQAKTSGPEHSLIKLLQELEKEVSLTMAKRYPAR